MTLTEKIKNALKEMLSIKRYEHTLRVAETAKKLAIKYRVDEYKAELAGLLHDCGKKLSHKEMSRLIYREYEIMTKEYDSPNFLHGFAGAVIARNRFRIDDKEILDAIKYHTVGRKRMTLLDKIIYLADVIEPGRKNTEIVKIREKAFENIDEAILMEVNNKIKYLLDEKRIIHANAIEMRNNIMLQHRKKGD